MSEPEKSHGVSVGTAVVSLTGGLCAASFLLESRYQLFGHLTPVLLCGFIGGCTNTIAIKMLFNRYWYLPGSGVILKRRRQIIDALAVSVERYIINPEMLEKRLREALRRVDVERLRGALNAVLDEFRADLLEYVQSEEVHSRIRRAIGEQLGFFGRVVHWTGIKDLDVAADDLQEYLSSRVMEFKVTPEFVNAIIEKTGTLEEFLFKENNLLVQKHYGSSESLVKIFLGKLDVRSTVVDKLSEYPPEKIRDIVSENIRKHLAWLEVFGVILGMAFSVLFFAAR